MFLPIAKLNTNTSVGEFPGFPFASSTDNGSTSNQFVVLANQAAVDKYIGENSSLAAGAQKIPDGFINGVSPVQAATTPVVVDQGLDTTQLSYTNILDQDLNEDTYIVQVDNRILKIASPDGTQAVESFVDTDSIATYVINGPAYYSNGAGGQGAQFGQSPIQGPRGSIFKISFFAASEVASSDFLYNQLGTTKSSYFPDSTNAKVIDTVVKLTGNKTGITLDIPVRIARSVS